MSNIEDVRAFIVNIPAGQVISYGQIGAMIGMGPRQVGHAMTLLDDDVPWWRVVYADGTPSSCHHGQAIELLRAEKTPMVGRRVDVQLARYTPSAAARS